MYWQWEISYILEIQKKRHFIKTRHWEMVLQSLENGNLSRSWDCDCQKNESATSSAFFSGWQGSGNSGALDGFITKLWWAQAPAYVCLIYLCSWNKDAGTCIVSLNKANSSWFSNLDVLWYVCVLGSSFLKMSALLKITTYVDSVSRECCCVGQWFGWVLLWRKNNWVKETNWPKFCGNKENPSPCLKTYSCNGCMCDLNPP